MSVCARRGAGSQGRRWKAGVLSGLVRALGSARRAGSARGWQPVGTQNTENCSAMRKNAKKKVFRLGFFFFFAAFDLLT